jgi:hypothetical protein
MATDHCSRASFVIAHRPSSIIRRAATTEEVANMVVYAASLQASATTGAALRVDGGVIDTIAWLGRYETISRQFSRRQVDASHSRHLLLSERQPTHST